MTDLYLLSVIIFFAVLAILIYFDRKNIEFKYILIMRRTKRFKSAINNIAKSSPKFWKILSTIAIIICFYYMAQGILSLSITTYLISIGKIIGPPLAIILPTPSPVGATGPGYFLIPFWFWIITVAVILIPHELMHGIIARAEKIPLKSVGLLLLAIFPGAFVEPNENKLKKAKLLTKLRVFAAGSFANFALAAIIFSLATFVIWPAATEPAISLSLTTVNASSPAELAGLKPNMSITEINGKQITTSYFESLSGNFLSEELKGVNVSQTISVKANETLFNVTLGLHPETNTTYMGIVYEYSSIFKPWAKPFMSSLLPLLLMLWLFSFGVGLFNILPIYPLDGGLMVEAILEKFSKKNAKHIVKTITYFVLMIIIFNFIGPSLL